ncbi:MAG: ABC transporter permease [Bryobacteraceae bacterium]
MPSYRDHVRSATDSIRAHKLRASLTVLGLTMGVATLIMVMTIIEGANVYVEKKVADLGTNVFQIARLPFASVDFMQVVKAMRNKQITREHLAAVATACRHCQAVGASSSYPVKARYRDLELEDTTMTGHTPAMSDIDTRSIALGRYFTDSEDRHAAAVCVIGDKLASEFFPSLDPVGKTLRLGQTEFTVIGVYSKIGSVLGQDRDKFAIVPMTTFLRLRGQRTSLTIQAKASGGREVFEWAQDEARVALRSARHVVPGREEDFFIGTADSYIELWESISSRFFAVFLMVSAISAVVGGIVIMNVMLVTVTERTQEIGVRRAVGATQGDILRLFLAESVLECLAGGMVGVAIGFGCALALRTFTDFPAAVEGWVAALGVGLSCSIGLFFGIYPAMRAARLDPVVALRAE